MTLRVNNDVTDLCNLEYLWNYPYTFFDKTSAVSNGPTTIYNGIVSNQHSLMGSYNFGFQQLSDGNNELYFRRLWYNSWSPWKQVFTTSGGTISGYLTVNKDIIVNGAIRSTYYFGPTNADVRVRSGSSSKKVYLQGSSVNCMKYDSSTDHIPIYASAFTVNSSKRYKENIRNLDDSDALRILKLRPVIYDYINKKDGTDCIGFIAEDVEKYMKYPIVYDNEKPNGIDYSKFVTPIIKVLQIYDRRFKTIFDTLKLN